MDASDVHSFIPVQSGALHVKQIRTIITEHTTKTSIVSEVVSVIIETPLALEP